MPAGIPTLTAPRLILRPLELSDAPAVQAVFPRWEIVRFLAARVPWPYPPDGALMAEAVEVITAFWFEDLGRTVMQVPKAAANLPSRRMSERAGMRLIERTERDYVSGRLPAEIWEITREAWRNRRRARPGTATQGH